MKTPLFSFLALCITSVCAGKYDYFPQPATWQDARDRCQNEGKYLARVDELIEHTRIQKMQPYLNMQFWIGLRGAGNSYQWTDATKAVFTAWGQGQPSSQSDCVRYRPSDLMWETYNCSATQFFLCENEAASGGKAATSEAAIVGLLMGFGVMVGLLLIIAVILNMPCCRATSLEAFASFGLGRRD